MPSIQNQRLTAVEAARADEKIMLRLKPLYRGRNRVYLPALAFAADLVATFNFAISSLELRKLGARSWQFPCLNLAHFVTRIPNET
jgi:hypothetical protein